MSLFIRLLILCASLAFVAPEPLRGEPRPRADHSWVSPLSENQRKRFELPDTLAHRTFRSPSMGIDVGFYMYLPPGYEETETRYPVVFHLHGGRPGAESKSVRIARFVDAAIRDETIAPTIYVFPNGGPMSWYNYPHYLNGLGEDVFVKELIPHIRKTFRTRELAIEGFSQGGRGTTRILLKHPELFVSAAPGGSGYGPEKRIQENDGAESEHVVFAKGDNTWDLAAAYARRSDKDQLPILLWVGTEGFNYDFNLSYSDQLTSLGIPHKMLIAEGVDHSAVRFYEKRGLELMQFHQGSFAPAGE